MDSDTSDEAGSRWFILLLLGIVVALVGAITIPNFVRARTTKSLNACVNNLRQIAGAKEQWALENKKKPGDLPMDADLFGPSLYMREKPVCPEGGTYKLSKVGEKPMCSLSNKPGHVMP